MNNRIAIGLAAVVLAAVGFLLYRGVSEPAAKPAIEMPTEPPAPAHPWPDAELQGSPVKSAVITPGKGASPTEDQVVEASWKGWVLATEVAFADAPPKKFLLSKSPAVKGVNQALATMKPGETRLLQLPSDLAYGQTGSPPAVPRDAEVMMLVTLHTVEEAMEAPEKPSDAATTQAIDGVQYAVLAEGSGAEAKAGDKVKLHFSMFLADGTLIDSTLSRFSPVAITIGRGDVFAGLDRSVPGMKVGEKRKLVVPPELGAGKEARGPIPANSTLIFEVQLVSIE